MLPLLLFLSPSIPGCFSPLSLPGVVAMAREPAQMAGQLAFRGSAPQLKLPHFSFFPLHSSSAQTFGLKLFYVWQAFIAVCRGKTGSSMGWRVAVGGGGDLKRISCPRINGTISISGNSTEGPEKCQWQSLAI